MWAREFRYREAEKTMSEATQELERGRAQRLADVFSFLPLIKDERGFRWHDSRPHFRAWIERMYGYPSIAEILPPLEY